MIRRNKWKAILSSLIILIPALLGVIFRDRIGAPYNAGGALTVILLPCPLLVLHWLCLLITTRDNRNNGQSPKILSMVFWICPVLSLYASGILWALMLGLSFNPFRLLCLMMGVGLILIGNYMPKARPNRTFGIRIRWTLESDENWAMTHRFCGRLWVIAGAVTLLGVFLPAQVFPYFLITLLLAVTVPPVVYSYRLYRKRRTDELAPITSTVSPMPRWAGILTAVLLTVILAGCAVITFTGNVESECTDTTLSVSATYWKNIELAYNEIDTVEYREAVDGERVSGFGSPRLSLGWFRNDEFGNYTRYTYTKIKPCVVLTVNGETVVINCANEAQTKSLYNELIARIGG